jgi:hypothetical protein
MAAMTTAQVSTEVPKGFVIQIGGNKTSLTRPADYVLSASNVPPRGDRRITAQTQRFRESLDERACRTAADLPDPSRRVKIL